MANHAASKTLLKPVLDFWKMCVADHEKQVGNKCEKIKNVSKI